jgi:DNA polymerase-3 subunit delta'
MSLFPLVNQQFNRLMLENTIRNGRIANAYLFFGEKGSGHEGFALEFAAMLNCNAPEKGLPCSKCSACHKMCTLEHANLMLVFPIPRKQINDSQSPPFKGFSEREMQTIQEEIARKAQSPYEKISVPGALHIPINFIREIKRKIYLTSAERGWKVVVILDAHLMTDPAANALLKILEEPPPSSTLILTSSNPKAILSTVRSRCQPLFFPPLAETDITSDLTERGTPAEQIKLISSLSSGDLNAARNFSPQDIQALNEIMLEILRSIAGWKIAKIFVLINQLAQLHKTDSEQFRQILQSLNFWARDAAVLTLGTENPILIHSDLGSELNNFIHAYPDFDAENFCTSVDNCIDFIQRNVYINLALTELFFKIRNCFNIRKSS